MSELTTRAVFRRKETEIEATDCVVDKVIRLTGAEFDRFSHNLLRDWDFIRDNPIGRAVDDQGRHHCLLVTGDGRSDGILVNPEGGSHARYSALLPNAEAWLAAEQYPAIADLTQKLVRALKRAEGLIEAAAGEVSDGGPLVIDIDELGDMSDIDFDYNQILLDTVTEMIGNLPGVETAELDDRELILYRAEDSPERSDIYRQHGIGIAEAAQQSLNPAVPVKPSDIDSFGHDTAEWLAAVERNPGNWREDTRYRKHNDGTLFYLGGEAGQYMRLAGDGKLTVGRYELARPGIADAVLVAGETKDAGSYESAVLLAARLGGARFLSDLDGMEKYTPPETLPGAKPSVMKQIREAKAAPKTPRKDKSPDKHKGDAEL